MFTGDTVTLSCDVGQLTGWTIHWRKDSNTESTSDATKTISSVSVSDGGRYRCRARRGEYYSEYSDTAEITVRGKSCFTFYTVFNGRQLCVCYKHDHYCHRISVVS